MSRKVRIWTLNKATALIDGREEAIAKIFEQQGIQCEFGNRKRPVNDRMPSHQLMYEPKSKQQTDADEYFVPIPLKCIGKQYRKNERDTLPESGRLILEQIVKHYSQRADQQGNEQNSYFSDHDDSVFRAFWSLGDNHVLRKTDQAVRAAFGRARMATKDFQGYYDILDSNRDDGEQHILIGYSQGGLVARYLAFLDEYVFQKNIIAGVITIAAPNYGSPLANPDNRHHIANGVIQIAQTAQKSGLIKMLRRFVPAVGVIIDTLSAHSLEDDNYDALYSLIKTSYENRVKELEPTQVNNDTLASLLKTAIKWLSGMQDDPLSAFDELDIRNYDKPYSVLYLVNHPQYPLKATYSGAVITGNNITTGLISSLMASFHPFLARLSGLVHAGLRGVIWVIGPLNKRIQRYNSIYRNTIMTEYGDNIPDAPITMALAENYQKAYPQGPGAELIGSKTLTLPAQAHDFVIPSVYQVVPDKAEQLLGHRVNLKANHNSGQVIKSRPGQQNWQYTKDLLTILAQRLGQAS